jgi:hypothetical protein
MMMMILVVQVAGVGVDERELLLRRQGAAAAGRRSRCGC